MNLLRIFAELELTWIVTWAIFHALWQGCIIWLVFRAAFSILNESKAVSRYHIGLGALVCACGFPLVTSLYWHPRPVQETQLASSNNLEPNTVILEAPNDAAILKERARRATGEANAPNPAPDTSNKTSDSTDRSDVVIPVTNQNPNPSATQLIANFSPLLVLAWLLGVCLFAIRPVLGFLQVRKLRTTGLSDVAPEIKSRFETASRNLGIQRIVRIFESRLVAVPTVVGFWRQAVLIPASLPTGLTSEELDAILCHELAHIRRNDTLQNALQVIVETLLFFHPAIWSISKAVRSEREKCCDDLAATSEDSRKTLAKALLLLEETRSDRSSAWLLTSHGGDLKSRVTRLLNPSIRYRQRSMFLEIIVASLVIIGFTASFIHNKADATIVTPETQDKWELVSVTAENLSKTYSWKKMESQSQKTAQKLADVFPQIDSGRKGKTPASWKAEMVLTFTKKNSTTGATKKIRVAINFQKGLWSEGNGDWTFQPTWAYRYAMADLIRENRTHRSKPVDDKTKNAKQQQEHEKRFKTFLKTSSIKEDEAVVRTHHWVVYGTIQDESGKPLPLTTVSANFGYVDRFGAMYTTRTDKNGNYVLRFNQRVMQQRGSSKKPVQIPEMLLVRIIPSKWKYADSSFGKLGSRMTSKTPVESKSIVKNWPTRIDFKMEKTATIRGQLTTPDGQKLQNRKIKLDGYSDPMGVRNLVYRRTTTTDSLGRFVFHEVPKNQKLTLSTAFGTSNRVEILGIREADNYWVSIQRFVKQKDNHEYRLKLQQVQKLKADAMPESAQGKLEIMGFIPGKAEFTELNFGPEQNGLAAAIRVKNGNFSHIQNEKWFNKSRTMRMEIVIRNRSQNTKTILTPAVRSGDSLSVVTADGKPVRVWSTTDQAVTAKLTLKPGQFVTIPVASFGFIDPEKPVGLSANCGYQAALQDGAYRGKIKLNFPSTQLSGAEIKNAWKGSLETGPFNFRIGKPKRESGN